MHDTLSTRLLKQDFISFLLKSFNTVNPGTVYQHNWHLELLSDLLLKIENKEIKRLVINIPPRSLKSILINVCSPAWLLGVKPSRKIITASYSEKLSKKHIIDSKAIISENWYSDLFPDFEISKDQNCQYKFITTKRGYRFSTSVGSSIIGEGGDYMILDDPHHPNEIMSEKKRDNTLNWFENAFLTRLNDKKKGAIILIMQRLHNDDLSGAIQLDKNNWLNIVLPAYFKDAAFLNLSAFSKVLEYEEAMQSKRDDIYILGSLKKEMGEQNFTSQYMQSPLETQGTIFKKEWFQYYSIMPSEGDYYVSIDSAIKVTNNSDYTVISIWKKHEQKYYLIDIVRDKFEYPSLKQKVKIIYQKYQPLLCIIEDKSSGQALIQDLKKENLRIKPFLPKNDKLTRAARITCFFETSMVYFPIKSDFKSVLENELLTFPMNKNDDIVDSVSQFFQYIIETENRVRDIPFVDIL